MARVLQLRKGDAEVNNIFIGSEAELTYVTDTKGLIIHDGDHRGGYHVPVVVDSMAPTEENDYTWYRKYSDGWVEQGGRFQNNATQIKTVTLSIPMSNEFYYKNAICSSTSATPIPVLFSSSTTTTINFSVQSDHDRVYWEAKGYAA